MPYTKFTFPVSAYFPQALQDNYSEAELRKEYSRLRDVAQKSLKRLGQSEFAGGETYRANVNKYKKLADIHSKSELAYLLTDISKFLMAKGSSISGLREIRRESINTWHEKGFDFVNKKNFDAWVRFLDFVKDQVGVRYLDEAEDVFRKAQKKGISIENVKGNFDYYRSHLDEMEEAPAKTGNNSSSKVRKKMK